MCGLLITPATWSVLLLCKIMSVNFCSCALVMKKLTKNFTGKIFPNLQCDTVKHLYFVGVNFLWFLWIWCHSWKYFNENFDTSHHRLFLHHIHEIFSTKLSKTTICKNFDPQNITTIQYLSVFHLEILTRVGKTWYLIIVGGTTVCCPHELPITWGAIYLHEPEFHSNKL